MSPRVIRVVICDFIGSDAKTCPVQYNFFWQVVQWEKMWGIVLFQSPKGGLTSLIGLHPSQGQMVTLGGKNGPFPYVGRDMPFPAGISITRIIKND
jgi:hypothetical protein